MITAHSCSSGWNYVDFKWAIPVYKPERYQLYYSCRLQLEENDYVNGELEDTTYTQNSFRVIGLRPSSACALTFFAVYNPASIDQGISVQVKTLNFGMSLKCKIL